MFESIPSGEACRALLLLCEFYCRDRPPAFVTLDGKSQAMKFIEPKPVHCPSLSVSQNDGFADKLGLSPVKFSKDRARAHFSGWHFMARFGWMYPAGRTRKRTTRGGYTARGWQRNLCWLRP